MLAVVVMKGGGDEVSYLVDFKGRLNLRDGLVQPSLQGADVDWVTDSSRHCELFPFLTLRAVSPNQSNQTKRCCFYRCRYSASPLQLGIRDSTQATNTPATATCDWLARWDYGAVANTNTNEKASACLLDDARTKQQKGITTAKRDNGECYRSMVK